LIDASGELRTARYIPWDAEKRVAQMDSGFVAYLHWISRRPHVVVEMGCFIHPAYQNVSHSEWLLDEIEREAQRLLPMAADGARVAIQTTVLQDDLFMRARLVDMGYRPV
jgi:hypothetical protein